MSHRVLVLMLVLGAACAAPAPKGRGGKCHSLSDCKPGLACIEGRCSTNLESIEGDVPEYEEPDAGGAATTDAGGIGEAGAGG